MIAAEKAAQLRKCLPNACLRMKIPPTEGESDDSQGLSELLHASITETAFRNMSFGFFQAEPKFIQIWPSPAKPSKGNQRKKAWISWISLSELSLFNGLR